MTIDALMRPDNRPAACPFDDDPALLDPGDPEPVWIEVWDAIGPDDVLIDVLDLTGQYAPLEVLA